MLICLRVCVCVPCPQGASILLERGNGAEARAAVMEVVRRHFRPEFLNRIDEIVQVGGGGVLRCASRPMGKRAGLGCVLAVHGAGFGAAGGPAQAV